MKGAEIRLALVLVLLALCWPLQALEVPLKYISYPDNHEGFSVPGSVEVPMAKDPPLGDWKLPSFRGESFYGQVLLGDRKHLLVVDVVRQGGTRYNRLYFDANANGTLLDDAVMNPDWDHNGGYAYRYVGYFPGKNVTIVVDGKEMPFRFQAKLSYSVGRYSGNVDPKSLRLTLSSKCGYEGSFQKWGTRYRFVLCDFNTNGRFSDAFRLAKEQPAKGPLEGNGDRIYMAADVPFYYRPLHYTDGQFLGDYLVAGRYLYSVAVNTSRRRMTLTPIRDGLATLRIPHQPDHPSILVPMPFELARLSITSADGSCHVMMVQPAEAASVPPGEYRLCDYLLHRTDPQGDRWRLWTKAMQESPGIKAEANATTPLVFGEPFTPMVEASDFSRKRFMEGKSSNVSLELIIKGQAQEQVWDLSRIKGNKTKVKMSRRYSYRPEEPTYKVIQSDGRMVALGSFDYG